MNLRRDWNEFFFSMRPATTLGLFRMAFGTIIFCWGLLIAPDLKTWYSEQGLMPLAAMHVWGANPNGFDLLGHVTNFGVTIAALALLMISSFCVAVGYKTRIAQVIMYLLLTSFHHRDMIILNGGDTLQRNMSFLLMFADSGAACSIDRLLRIRRGLESASDTPMVEAWPQRLMQLQLSAVYISTVLSKIMGPEWQDGTALYYALHLTDLRRFTLWHLENQAWFYTPFTYATLITEFSLGTFIWVRRLRPYVLLMGVGLHFGIEYAMTVPLFSYTMISCYLNFVPTEWVMAFREWIRRQLGRSGIAIPAQLKMPPSESALLYALDTLKLVRRADMAAPVNDPALVRRVFWRFPATWAIILVPPALILVILPIRWFLVSFDIVWPVLTLGLLFLISQRIAARIETADAASSAREKTAAV